jgi:hypothetical protein
MARAMAAATPPPMPPAAIMVINIMNGKTSAKPASAGVPSRPKMKVSAMATKVWATITAVVGPASFSRLRPIGAVSRGWDKNAPGICVHMHPTSWTVAARAPLSPDKMPGSH